MSSKQKQVEILLFFGKLLDVITEPTEKILFFFLCWEKHLFIRIKIKIRLMKININVNVISNLEFRHVEVEKCKNSDMQFHKPCFKSSSLPSFKRPPVASQYLQAKKC